MNVVARRTLVAFWTKHAGARAPLTAWLLITSKAVWSSFEDVRATFNSADHVGGARVVFNIGGNNFRLVGLVAYRTKRVFVLWIGTHAEYDKIDVTKL
jgi:mRNA interferase HigB